MTNCIFAGKETRELCRFCLGFYQFWLWWLVQRLSWMLPGAKGIRIVHEDQHVSLEPAGIHPSVLLIPADINFKLLHHLDAWGSESYPPRYQKWNAKAWSQSSSQSRTSGPLMSSWEWKRPRIWPMHLGRYRKGMNQCLGKRIKHAWGWSTTICHMVLVNLMELSADMILSNKHQFRSTDYNGCEKIPDHHPLQMRRKWKYTFSGVANSRVGDDTLPQTDTIIIGVINPFVPLLRK